MNLRAVSLEDRYKTYEGPSPVTEFFIPCLKNSVKYDRAVGYFTSSGVEELEDGLKVFQENLGRIRLITSTRLEFEDLEDIRNGYSLREKSQANFHKNLEEIQQTSPQSLGYIGMLIKNNILDIKIAVFKNNQDTLYHEKIGFFSDHQDQKIYFIGSNNETHGGHVINGESFEVLSSWNESRRVKSACDEFEKLWNGQVETLEVLQISQVSRELLERHAISYLNPPDKNNIMEPQKIVINDEKEIILDDELINQKINLRPYQKDAVNSWINNGGRGVLKMATGTGKTVTAIGAIRQLLESKPDIEPLLILITCPYENLITQWDESFSTTHFKRVLCYVSKDIWFGEAQQLLTTLQLQQKGVGIFITTHATFSKENLRNLISSWRGKLLVISDEVHHMGAKSRYEKLPANNTFTMGLSATPERHGDPIGTAAIFEYFGPVVYELPLEKAIQMGFLSPYEYLPIEVHLNDDEFDIYKRLTARIAQLAHQTDGELIDDGNPELYKAFRARNAALGNCESKLAAFKEQVLKRKDLFYQLVYCSEGASELQEDKQLNEVLKILGHELELTARKYISGVSKADRQKILNDLKAQNLKFVVSMKCLDEGVDIPDARVAYILASSTDPRQWVQRRGRILRLPSDGQPKLATILDFVTLPPIGLTSDIARNLVDKELERVGQFGKDSMNPEVAQKFESEIRKNYGVVGGE